MMGSVFDTMYTSSMDEDELDTFHIMLEKSQKGVDTFRIPRVDPLSVSKVMIAVTMTDPEYRCQYSGAYGVRDYGNSFEITLKRHLAPMEEMHYRKRMQDRIKEISKRVLHTCSNDYEKVVAIHDEILDGLTYTKDLAHHRNIYNPFGTLVDKFSVCQGIALAFSMVAKEVGVDSANLGNEGMLHCWNMVRIGSRYCNVDATWDLSEGGITHDYLNVSDRRFMVDHLCKLGPICDTDEFDWYRMNGLYFPGLIDIHEHLREGVRCGKRKFDFEYGRQSMSDVAMIIGDVLNGPNDVTGVGYSFNKNLHTAHVVFK